MNNGNQKQQKHKEIIVYIIRRDSKCAECGVKLSPGAFLYLDKEKPLCLACADLDHLEFLPRGDMALSRRAKKKSKMHAVVLQWSRTRKQYERQGLLVEHDAIEQAKAACISDEQIRDRRRQHEALKRAALDKQYVYKFAAEVLCLFPKCPKKETIIIAEHACEKYSGRIGRAAFAKQLAPDAVLLAVKAHIRHKHTKYDELIMKNWDRLEARRQVQDRIDVIILKWQGNV